MHPVIKKMLRDRGVGESFDIVDCSDDFDMDPHKRRYSGISTTSYGGATGQGCDGSMDNGNAIYYGYDDNDDYDDHGIGEGVILLDDNAELWRADRFGELSKYFDPVPVNSAASVSSQWQVGSVQDDADRRFAAAKSMREHAHPVVQPLPHSHYQQYPEFQLQYLKQFPLQYDSMMTAMPPPSECALSMETQLAGPDSPRKRKRRKSSFQGEGAQKLRLDHDGLDRPYLETRMCD
ncbi:uncharacterized protein V1513DRAFT_477378 [Lipomyces chichibuensis]|uniref:uncharacterized protein n=1 Tax=Lipomyces chichibuensis TaxID=1546026 RepID=UPI0033430AE7